jgi:2-keto-4-pentenoate hydratase/2-oxohepta-3-ene-1,7-dioic acid hydratase in catechol pathway
MRLVTFRHHHLTRVGALAGAELIDLAAAAPALPTDMLGFLAAGPEALAAARAARGPRLAVADVELLAPIPRPPKILAIGLNYADHAAESGQEVPQVPKVFNKQSTAVVGPGAAIHRPRVSPLLDYEGELAIVIGRRCRHVPRADAAEVIAGYTIANDVTVRDWQLREPTWTMGKSFDTHCPLGPALVTPDEAGDPAALEIQTFVNGERRQHSNTRQLIFDGGALIEFLSTAFTLEPGDVICTGTPGGVGMLMQPPQWLAPGDVVRVEIAGLGALENPVIEEPEDTARL